MNFKHKLLYKSVVTEKYIC